MAVIIDNMGSLISPATYITTPITPITFIPEFDDLITKANYITSPIYNVVTDEFEVIISAGSLRVGGDAPIGVVTLNGNPVARTVDLFDRLEKVLVQTTTSSAVNGSFTFQYLSNRVYDIIIRGNSGEKDIIIAGVTPVA